MAFHVPEKFRLRQGPMGSNESAGNNGMFIWKGLHGQRLNIIASNGEEWRPVKDFEGLYEVSTLGKVRALPKDVAIPHGAKRHHELKILHSETNKECEYPRVTLCGHGKQQKYLVHLLVAEAFIANPFEFQRVNHINGNKEDAYVTNLEWCTVEYNIHHAIETGLKSGFKAEDIEQIKQMLDSGMTTTEIASLLEKKRYAITDIKFGRHRNLNPKQPSRYTGLPLWEHVSASRTDRMPTWEEMCRVKDIFWDDTDCVIQYHPPKSDYVNNHLFCLHLWRPIGIELPRPDSIFVGHAGMSAADAKRMAEGMK